MWKVITVTSHSEHWKELESMLQDSGTGWQTNPCEINTKMSNATELIVTVSDHKQFLQASMEVFAFQDLSQVYWKVLVRTQQAHLPYQCIWFA